MDKDGHYVQWSCHMVQLSWNRHSFNKATVCQWDIDGVAMSEFCRIDLRALCPCRACRRATDRPMNPNDPGDDEGNDDDDGLDGLDHIRTGGGEVADLIASHEAVGAAGGGDIDCDDCESEIHGCEVVDCDTTDRGLTRFAKCFLSRKIGAVDESMAADITDAIAVKAELNDDVGNEDDMAVPDDGRESILNLALLESIDGGDGDVIPAACSVPGSGMPAHVESCWLEMLATATDTVATIGNIVETNPDRQASMISLEEASSSDMAFLGVGDDVSTGDEATLTRRTLCRAKRAIFVHWDDLDTYKGRICRPRISGDIKYTRKYTMFNADVTVIPIVPNTGIKMVRSIMYRAKMPTAFLKLQNMHELGFEAEVGGCLSKCSICGIDRAADSCPLCTLAFHVDCLPDDMSHILAQVPRDAVDRLRRYDPLVRWCREMLLCRLCKALIHDGSLSSSSTMP